MTRFRPVSRNRLVEPEERAVTQVVPWDGGALGASTAVTSWERRRLIRDTHDREGFTTLCVSAVAADFADTHNIPLVVENASTGDRLPDDNLVRAFNVAAQRDIGAGILRQHLWLSLVYAGAAPLLVSGDGSSVTPLVGVTVEVLTPREAGTPETHPDGSPRIIGAWRLTAEDGKVLGTYRPEEHRLIMPMVPHPENLRETQPIVSRIGMSIDVLHYKRQAVRTHLRGGGLPAGFLLLKGSMQRREQEAFERATNAKLTSPERRGKWATIKAEEATPIPLTGKGNVTDGWVELADDERKVIQSALFVPDARLAGFTGGQTYENQAQELAQYYRAGLSVWLAHVEEAINLWAMNGGNPGVRYRFDLSDHPALQEDRSGQWTRARDAAASVFATLAEIREEAGLPVEEWMRGLFVVNGRVVTEQDMRDGWTPVDHVLPSADVDAGVSPPPFPEPADRAFESERRDLAGDYVAALDRGIDEAEAVLVEFAQRHNSRVAARVLGAFRRIVEQTGEAPELAQIMNVGGFDDELTEDLPRVFAAAVKPVAVALPEALAHVDEAGADAMRRWIGADPEARFADALARRVRILITGEGAADGYRGWNQTIADDVAAALQASRDEGEDLGQLSHRLRETLGDDATRARAMTIARTEANGLANDLAHEAFAASGVVKRKRWYSIGDNRSRASHVAANGQTVDWDEMFDVGGHRAERPHDPRLPASETVNCRCRLIPVTG